MSRVSYRNYNRCSTVGRMDSKEFKNLTEIETVLNKLKESIKTKGSATVAEYYELTGGFVTENDSDFGWTDFLNAAIETTRYGYELRLPFPCPIKSNPISDAYKALVNADEDDLQMAVEEAANILESAL